MCQSKEGEPWGGSDQTIMFQEAVTFLRACAEGVSRICLRSGNLIYSYCVGALTSPTGGGRSVGRVRSRTKATEFSFLV